MIAPAGGVRVWMAMPSALVTSPAVGRRRSTSRPPDGSRRPAPPRSRPCLPWWGLGDIGHPQLVRAAAREAPVDQVGGDLVGLGMAPLGPPGDPGEAGAARQQRNRVVADHAK